mmetsp:Transcript_867/g.1999  ORF Transcript_867/g.1999 Transcript_867/m.1999 type:complete len:131 (-) Transcript_867:420-812(-)
MTTTTTTTTIQAMLLLLITRSSTCVFLEISCYRAGASPSPTTKDAAMTAGFSKSASVSRFSRRSSRKKQHVQRTNDESFEPSDGSFGDCTNVRLPIPKRMVKVQRDKIADDYGSIDWTDLDLTDSTDAYS